MRHLTFVFLVVFTLLVTGINHAQEGGAYDYDVLIKNGRIFDGSLRPAFEADVAVKDGKIVRVDKRIQGTADRVIDAEGLFVMPGFIDLHTHVDRGMTFPENRACLNYLLQGVTTIVVGQCGSSAWPIFEKAEDQMHRWSEEGIGPNAALLAGHGTVREIVMGMEERSPTQLELEAMKALVKEAMDQGAYGLSTGLIYPPGSYAKTDEIIELVSVIAPYGGIYHTHIRSESNGLIEAIGEAIRISEESGAQTHISHFKAIGRPYWGSVKDACVLIEYARKRGLKITTDQYPYRFSNNYPYRSLIPTHVWRGNDDAERLTDEDIVGIFDCLRDDELIHLYKKVTPYIPLSEHHQQFLDALTRKRLVRFVASQLMRPSWFQGPENDRERMLFLQRMDDTVEAQEIREAVRNYIQRLGGAENLMVGICVEKELEGQSLQQIADAKGKSVEDVAIELELMGAKVVPLQMCEEDIEYIMKKEYVGTGSDGEAPYYGIDLPHIRSYSTFLHKIKKYGQERKTVSIAHIIRSQTSFAAEVMNWRDRGLIKPSYQADVVVLDMDNIETRTSISNPHQYSKGVEFLLVNGKVVIEEGRYNGTLAGDVIKLKK